MRAARLALVLAACGAVAACSTESEVSEGAEDAERVEIQPVQAATDAKAVDAAAVAAIGTPMEDRVATLGLLNKRNNTSQDVEMRPGETQTFGDIRINLSACERTAPWEMQRETGAFIQVEVQPRGSDDFERIFSGWVFKNSPSLNVVEHAIYDVWVKDCAMSFPGEE